MWSRLVSNCLRSLKGFLHVGGGANLDRDSLHPVLRRVTYIRHRPCRRRVAQSWNGPTRMILISPKFSGHRQAYKIRIIFSFRGLPASATSSLIKTNSCLTQSYPAICEVLQAELRPQIILTPFNKAVMLIRSRQI